MTSTGPLVGVSVIEIASMAPAPFGCTMLADMGAEVTLVDRPGPVLVDHTADPLRRGRRSVVLDLKSPRGVELLLELVAGADVLVEGFRPGVAERLGFGPETVQAVNPRLVYARMTGWGQTGPLAHTAGHDINYIAASGALSTMGPPGTPPVPPTNGLADFAGGGMVLALGVVAALLERTRSGLGQVVDVSMVDGSAMLTAYVLRERSAGRWDAPRGMNLMDGGSPFYRTYETSDGRYVAVGALEPAFYAELLAGLGLDPADVPDRDDRDAWPALQGVLARRFVTRTQAAWTAVFDGTDACVTPVVDAETLEQFPHNADRGVFRRRRGMLEPSPAPRFSRTPSAAGSSPAPGADSGEILAVLGITDDEYAALVGAGVVGELPTTTPEMRTHD